MGKGEKMKEKNCQHCGKELVLKDYETNNSKRRYCGYECYYAGRESHPWRTKDEIKFLNGIGFWSPEESRRNRTTCLKGYIRSAGLREWPENINKDEMVAYAQKLLRSEGPCRI